MIGVIMHVRTKPDKTARFVELVTQLQQDVHMNEPDTLHFQVMRSPDDRDAFAFSEVFRNRAAFEAHALQPYHVAMSEEGWACLDGEPDIRMFDCLGDTTAQDRPLAGKQA
ncbi:antibiotic biosynthesis monooxygenase [Croceicoccus ponticola]|uniref:Antibiotic biosynthesis monooxygenase n=1 Tax=Croceicoccus ponticola TaxID=2217664 RepID=A0A437GU46_9SPHN|nr:antibiotic biosynthesis monooxygenase family protein [Croceicoccus ponticola]RVQ64729.1 antibiotic biosynthesis monooxygenase [Croceicoccus ponticola]